MRNPTDDAGATPWWAKRRTLASALAVSLLVAGGAAARASTNGDGFLNPPYSAAHAGSTTASSSYGGGGYGTQGTTTGGYRDGWTWNGTDYMWNGDTWGWQGGGANKFAFRTIVDRADPTFNQLLGINDMGRIVGYYGSGEDAEHPNKGFEVTSPYKQRSFLEENFPGSAQTQVVAINNTGWSAGFYVDSHGANHGFVRHEGHYRTVDFPGTTSSPSFNQLLGINRFGIAVGFFNDAKGHSHAFLFNVRTGQFALVRLPVRAESVVATGINDHGQIVGFFQVGKVTKGFILGSGGFTVLNFGNHTNTQALGVNNFGVVVGSFVDGHGRTHGFVRLSSHLVRVVDAPGATDTVVNGLNNKGSIVGFFTDSKKDTLGFLAHR
jgi:hypothetical protein